MRPVVIENKTSTKLIGTKHSKIRFFKTKTTRTLSYSFGFTGKQIAAVNFETNIKVGEKAFKSGKIQESINVFEVLKA